MFAGVPDEVPTLTVATAGVNSRSVSTSTVVGISVGGGVGLIILLLIVVLAIAVAVNIGRSRRRKLLAPFKVRLTQNWKSRMVLYSIHVVLPHIKTRYGHWTWHHCAALIKVAKSLVPSNVKEHGKALYQKPQLKSWRMLYIHT